MTTRELTHRFAQVTYGVPAHRYAVVCFGGGPKFARFAGHYPATEAMAKADEEQEQYRRNRPGRPGRIAYLVRHDGDTLTVYRDLNTPLGTMPILPIAADLTLGTGGTAECCSGHRTSCRFGREHQWAPWKRDGHLVRRDDARYCRFCRGVCLANEEQEARA